MKKQVKIEKHIKSNYNQDAKGINSNLVDSVRIFAAWCVLLGHCFSIYEITIFKNEEHFFYIQNMAVVIFFTLAGFLMVYSIEKRKEWITWKGYILHQAVRIYKIYIPALLLVALIDKINMICYPASYKYYDSYTIDTFLGNVLMLQNINIMEVVPRFASDMPLWTMAIEWWLYVICSFFYVRFYMQKKKDFLSIIAAVILAVIFIKYIYSGLAICFIFGMITYLLYMKRIKYSAKLYLSALLVVVSGILYVGICFRQAYIMPIFILIPFLFWILLEMGRNDFMKKSGNKYLRIYARSTFALYLLHYPIIELINNIGVAIGYKLFAVVLMSNIASIIVTLLFDRSFKLPVVKMYNECFPFSNKKKECIILNETRNG